MVALFILGFALELSTMPSDDSAREKIRWLIAELENADPSKGEEAADSLGSQGLAAQPALPTLRRALFAKNTNVGIAAAFAMLRIHPGEEHAILYLTRTLRDSNPEFRELSAQYLSLATPGPKSRFAIPALIHVLADSHEPIRGKAVEAIFQILPQKGKHAKAGVTALVNTFRTDPSEDVRDGVAWRLGRLGPLARPVLPSVLDGIRRESSVKVRAHAIRAIGTFCCDDSAILKILLDSLQSPDWFIRRSAAEGLQQAGHAARQAIPALVNKLQEPDRGVNGTIIETLGSMGKVAQAAIPALEKIASEGDATEAPDAIAALKKIKGEEK